MGLRKTCLCMLLLTTAFAAETWGSTRDQIVMAPGQTVSLTLPRSSQIRISNGRVLKATDRGTSIELIAKKKGQATVESAGQRWTVTVLSTPQYELYNRLAATIKTMRGLEISTEGHTLFVGGHLLRLDDWVHLAQIASGGNSSAEFRMIAKVDEALLAKAKSHFNDLLRKARLPDLSLELDPPSVTLAASLAKALRKQIQQTLGPYGFRIDESPSALTLEPLVRVSLIVAEFRTSKMLQFGIEWPTSVEAQLLPTPELPLNSSLQLNLRALESQGLGKILASPILLCRSGKEAQFLAGGEFPIKIIGTRRRDVVWKRHGVLLKIKPLADDTGRMSIGIEAEVSMIDSSQTVDGIPGLLSNRIETHFDLSRSRTIALSGLIKKEWGRTRAGLPGLSGIPVLGPLFSSRDYLDNKTELIVFVTPEIVRPTQGTGHE